MMVVGTQLLGRFVLIDYKYVVQDNNYNGYDFLIYKTQGKKVTKVCYVSLSKVIAIFRLTDLPDYQKKYGRTSNRFNYCVNIGAKETFVLILESVYIPKIVERKSSIITLGSSAMLSPIYLKSDSGITLVRIL